MKDKARNIIFFFLCAIMSILIGYSIAALEKENSQVVSSGSIIYEHGFPNVGSATLLVLDDEKRVVELESEIRLLEKEKEKLIFENQELEQENKKKELTDREWEYLYRVARAEAGATSPTAQKNVIHVVLNRINSEKFPDTIEEVIFQKSQFACVSNKSFWKVELSEDLKENVQEAYFSHQEGNNAEGALFFTKGNFNRTFLFEDCVGHRFYK